MVSAFYLRCASVPLGGQEQGVKQVLYHGSLGSVVNMDVCFFSEDWFVLYGPHSTDIEECIEGSSDCEQNCTNTAPGYICSCDTGYTLSENEHTCDCENKYAINSANDALSIS